MSAKLAKLYRDLAELFSDIADELDAEVPANDATPAPPKSRPRTLRGRPFPAPLSTAGDLSKHRARQMFKKRGGV